MRLIACPDCHTQYDVSEIIAPTLRCRCGRELENKALEGVEASVHRCGSCGAQLGAEAEDCTYCGSAIVQDPGDLSLICPECYARNAEASRFCTACGVAFRPEPVQVDGRDLPCPACSDLMPASHVGGVSLNECRHCNGIWVPGDNFHVLVSRATEARRAGRPLDRELPRVTGANPLSQRVQYRKCPECDGFMHRRNYQKSSGVIIDICREHGTWLDADELEQIAGFILSGGTTSPVLEAEHQKASAEAAAAAAFARMRVRQDHLRLSMSHHDDPGSGLVGMLAKILFS